MDKKSLIVLTTIAALSIIILSILQMYFIDKKVKCNNLGGVYINEQCFKAERINL